MKPRGWTCKQSRMLNERLRRAKLACRDRAKHEQDPYSRDAQLFHTLADAFESLESRHKH